MLEFTYHAAVYDLLLFIDMELGNGASMADFSRQLDQMAVECRKALGFPEPKATKKKVGLKRPGAK